MTLLLRCDQAGTPMAWTTLEQGACCYASGRVVWDHGAVAATLVGGRSAKTGQTSTLTLRSIIAVRGRDQSLWNQVPNLVNRQLFARDRYLCMYCGLRFAARELTRDHVIPASRGGPDTWENCVTACRRCNQRKADRTPEEAGMRLLAVPHRPDRAQWLILANRRIIADQMEFLGSRTRRV